VTRWYRYVAKIVKAQGITYTEAATRMGIHASIFSNWKKGTEPSPKMVIHFARSMGESPLIALVEAELLTLEEANVRQVVRFEDRLVNLSTQDLLTEVGRRAGL